MMLEKPGRKRPSDPRAKKALDKKNQRKITAFSSDKSSRKSAPLHKARANRAVRASDRAYLSKASAEIEDSADQLRLKHKAKPLRYASHNTAEQRAWRDQERRYLDQTAGQLPKGRSRYRMSAQDSQTDDD